MSGLVDCFATTTRMPHEIDDSYFWTLRVEGHRQGAMERSRMVGVITK